MLRIPFGTAGIGKFVEFEPAKLAHVRAASKPPIVRPHKVPIEM